MGAGMPCAVTSIILERKTSEAFYVGMAEMNGWRGSMEDAHVIHMAAADGWGFFGVFDGHGGHECSEYVARRLHAELPKGKPEDDAAVRELCFKLDAEFLAMGRPSGSTGTFVVVELPHVERPRHRLRVGNVGDSRVLQGRRDGSMVLGPGTDGGLTTDHKPCHPDEIKRINRTGGHVASVMGVPRVNGDLAVSRAFGDGQYKQTGGPDPWDRPVTSEPEFTTCEAEASDFVILVCDGISERNFSNAEVVALVAAQLQEGQEPAAAATAVCREALARGSRDNLTCMVLLFTGHAEPLQGPERELLPGPFDQGGHEGFREAYEAFAKRAGYSIEECLEARFRFIQNEVAKLGDGAASESAAAMRQELASFDGGPLEGASDEERSKFFREWMTKQNQSQDSHSLEDEPPGEANEAHCVPVVLVGETRLRKILKDEDLEWDSQAQELCGQKGFARPSTLGGRRSVWFPEQGATKYFPGDAVHEHQVDVFVDVEELKVKSLESGLSWTESYSGACGQRGVVKSIDTEDSTANVSFPDPLMFTAWLPLNCLRDVPVE